MAKPQWEMVVPVLSTDHLAREAHYWLHDKSAQGFRGEGYVHKVPGGWFIFLGDDTPQDWFGVPCMPEIIAWFRCGYEGQTWIRFDDDGDIIDDLPTYGS